MIVRTLNQGSPEWLAWRRDGVGGSDAATILGVAPFPDATRDNLLREKVGGWERPVNFAMRRGTRLEPVARAAYQEHAGCLAPPACVEHPDAPWVRVSLDGLCRHRFDAGHGLPWVLELKCPGWETHSAALAGVVPDHYLPQCQWQLLATGLDLLHYASFSEHSRFAAKDRLAVVPVEPDAELQARLLDECGRFWAEVLAARGSVAGSRDRSQAVAG